MAETLRDAIRDAGPHTVESLAARLPDFPPEAIREALETLAAQGVLSREEGPDGAVRYRYVAPERYLQAGLDVVRDPAKQAGPR